MSRPPTSVESERLAVGLALQGGEMAELVSASLSPEDFSDHVCRGVFSHVQECVTAGNEVTEAGVLDATALQGAALADLRAKATGTSRGQASSCLGEIRRVSTLRHVYEACRAGAARVSKKASIEEVLAGLENDLYRLDKSGATEAREASSVLSDVLEDFKARYSGQAPPEVSTGILELDRAIVGLRPGKMLVIGGRPGMGKTALTDTIRRSVVDQGLGVVQFSLEMSAQEILEREVAFQARVNLRRVLAASQSRMTTDEAERVSRVDLSKTHGRWFIDDSTYSIGGMRRRARILKQRMDRAGVKLALVTVDYLQLAGENGDGREQQIAAISRGCKAMAKELGCTVIAVSQLNRACDNRDDKRPQSSDLRESGTIEQDADAILFVYREHIYDPSCPPEEAELLLRKQRSGPTGTIRVKYDPEHVTFLRE